MNFECLWEVQIICGIYCPLSLLFLLHKMTEAGGGEAGRLIIIFLFQIFPWGFRMENNFFLIHPKYYCLFYQLLNILFLFIFISINPDFFSELLLLFKHPTIFKLILDCPFISDGRVKYDKTWSEEITPAKSSEKWL